MPKKGISVAKLQTSTNTHKAGAPRVLVLWGQTARTYFMSSFPAGGKHEDKGHGLPWFIGRTLHIQHLDVSSEELNRAEHGGRSNKGPRETEPIKLRREPAWPSTVLCACSPGTFNAPKERLTGGHARWSIIYDSEAVKKMTLDTGSSRWELWVTPPRAGINTQGSPAVSSHVIEDCCVTHVQNIHVGKDSRVWELFSSACQPEWWQHNCSVCL